MFQKFSKNKEAEIKKVVPGNKDFKRKYRINHIKAESEKKE